MSETHIVSYRDRSAASVQVRYKRQGRGTPVVLIHGVGLQAAVWHPQIAALSAHHDVIALDMPGHGGSSLPPADARLGDYSGAVLALLDALAIERAHVIGHSMGALVALDFALDHPGRALSVTAMNAVFCRTPEQIAAVMARVEEAAAPSRDWTRTIARWFGDPIPDRLRETAARIEGFLHEIDPVGYARAYRVFATSDATHRDRLSGLVPDALFLTGADDMNSSVAMSQAMAAMAPKGRVGIVPNERHMMAVTVPGDIDRRLLAFLAEADAASAFDVKRFRKALGSFPTGITVVATLQDDGMPRGFTANSFTSVSLDPPLILICIAKTASSCPVFSSAEHFSVNILADHQMAVSNLFATKLADKFAKASWRRGPAGSPILDDVSAWFDCRQHKLIEAGDHVILIGEVIGFGQGQANPLGYCKGAYVSLSLDVDALAASGSRTRVGAIVEQDGAILLVPDGKGGLDLPWAPKLGTTGATASLNGKLAALGLKANPGLLFAVFDDPMTGAGAMSVVYRGTLREPPDASAPPLVPFDDVPWHSITDAAVKAMLRRYIEERQSDSFGVYVGDAERGTVQRLARSA